MKNGATRVEALRRRSGADRGRTTVRAGSFSGVNQPRLGLRTDPVTVTLAGGCDSGRAPDRAARRDEAAVHDDVRPSASRRGVNR